MKRDIITLGVLFIFLVIVWNTPVQAQETFHHYLTPEHNTLLNSDVCEEHDFSKATEAEIESLEIGFGIMFCANYVRVVDEDYSLGWTMFKEASHHINQITCECNLHNHADHVGYNSYIELTGRLAAGEVIDPDQIAYCRRLTKLLEVKAQVSAGS